MNYIKGLDGLRAISIILVLLFHSELNIGYYLIGWSGVTFFFVISGFLITSILLKQRGEDDYFKRFFIRRALRIFPVYFLLLIIIFIVELKVGRLEFTQAAFYMGYIQNYIYFVDVPRIDMLNHTWSLAIEEQFYLLWPVLVFFLNLKRLFKLSLILMVLGILFRLYFDFSSNELSRFYLVTPLPSAIDSLAIGSILAVTFMSGMVKETLLRISKFTIFLGLIGSLAIIIYIGSYTSSDNSFIAGLLEVGAGKYTQYKHGHFILTALSVFYAGIILNITANQKSAVVGFLEVKPISFVGKISYGIYLYHLPVFIAINYVFRNYVPELAHVAVFIIQVLITFIISYLSWVFFESKFLKLKAKY